MSYKKHLTPLTPLTPKSAYLGASKASLVNIFARQEAPVVPTEPPEIPAEAP